MPLNEKVSSRPDCQANDLIPFFFLKCDYFFKAYIIFENDNNPNQVLVVWSSNASLHYTCKKNKKIKHKTKKTPIKFKVPPLSDLFFLTRLLLMRGGVQWVGWRPTMDICQAVRQMRLHSIRPKRGCQRTPHTHTHTHPHTIPPANCPPINWNHRHVVVYCKISYICHGTFVCAQRLKKKKK